MKVSRRDSLKTIPKTKKKQQNLAVEGFLTVDMDLSKKSPTGPAERTPKPEYLIALATYLGVRW